MFISVAVVMVPLHSNRILRPWECGLGDHWVDLTCRCETIP
ncbi:mCG1041957 [Mus musculus]|nr:mCG1041957 [Mus musculus]